MVIFQTVVKSKKFHILAFELSLSCAFALEYIVAFWLFSLVRVYCLQLQVGCVALVLVSAADSVKGILLFTDGSRHYAAVFVSPLLQTFTFVRNLSFVFFLLKINVFSTVLQATIAISLTVMVSSILVLNRSHFCCCREPETAVFLLSCNVKGDKTEMS